MGAGARWHYELQSYCHLCPGKARRTRCARPNATVCTPTLLDIVQGTAPLSWKCWQNRLTFIAVLGCPTHRRLLGSLVASTETQQKS
eukprot:3405910-Amphidinium_carterae.1